MGQEGKESQLNEAKRGKKQPVRLVYRQETGCEKGGGHLPMKGLLSHAKDFRLLCSQHGASEAFQVK